MNLLISKISVRLIAALFPPGCFQPSLRGDLNLCLPPRRDSVFMPVVPELPRYTKLRHRGSYGTALFNQVGCVHKWLYNTLKKYLQLSLDMLKNSLLVWRHDNRETHKYS